MVDAWVPHVPRRYEDRLNTVAPCWFGKFWKSVIIRVTRTRPVAVLDPDDAAVEVVAF